MMFPCSDCTVVYTNSYISVYSVWLHLKTFLLEEHHRNRIQRHHITHLQCGWFTYVFQNLCLWFVLFEQDCAKLLVWFQWDKESRLNGRRSFQLVDVCLSCHSLISTVNGNTSSVCDLLYVRPPSMCQSGWMLQVDIWGVEPLTGLTSSIPLREMDGTSLKCHVWDGDSHHWCTGLHLPVMSRMSDPPPPSPHTHLPSPHCQFITVSHTHKRASVLTQRCHRVCVRAVSCIPEYKHSFHVPFFINKSTDLISKFVFYFLHSEEFHIVVLLNESKCYWNKRNVIKVLVCRSWHTLPPRRFVRTINFRVITTKMTHPLWRCQLSR